MTKLLRCEVCNEFVEDERQAAHLAEMHPTPAGGFKFLYEGRAYRSERPSMLVSELLALVHGNVTYQFYQQRPAGEMVPLSHGNAVDLTSLPRFYSIPSATF